MKNIPLLSQKINSFMDSTNTIAYVAPNTYYNF